MMSEGGVGSPDEEQSSSKRKLSGANGRRPAQVSDWLWLTLIVAASLWFWLHHR